MRNVTVALVSFALGAMFMLLLGNHTSTFSQGLVVGPSEGTLDVVGRPVVPPLTGIASVHNTFRGQNIDVDGIEADRNVYQGVTFIYGGGAYKLTNSAVVPPVNIHLVGAAANTAQFLETFGLIGCPTAKPQPPAVNPNAPRIMIANLKDELKGDLVAPFGATKPK